MFIPVSALTLFFKLRLKDKFSSSFYFSYVLLFPLLQIVLLVSDQFLVSWLPHILPLNTHNLWSQDFHVRKNKEYCLSFWAWVASLSIIFFPILCTLKFHHSIFLYRWVIVHYVYVPHVYYPFLSWWTSKLFPFASCWDYGNNEHKLLGVLVIGYRESTWYIITSIQHLLLFLFLFRKSFPVPISRSAFSIFSSSKFRLSGFMLRSLMYFVWCLPSSFVKHTVSSPMYTFWHLCQR